MCFSHLKTILIVSTKSFLKKLFLKFLETVKTVANRKKHHVFLHTKDRGPELRSFRSYNFEGTVERCFGGNHLFQPLSLRFIPRHPKQHLQDQVHVMNFPELVGSSFSFYSQKLSSVALI